MTTVRRHRFLLAGAVLLAGFLSMPAQAQSDDDTAPAATAPSPPPSDMELHHHGGGDDGDSYHPSLRQDPPTDSVLRPSTAPGLALDQSSLPGELGPTPERQRPLFSKSNDGLAQQSDPWALTVK